MVGVLGDPVEIRVDGVAERGERDEGLALKKRAAKSLLQPDNGIGQRGLGNATAFGRAGEITLLAERQKVADLVHLHVPRGINRASSRELYATTLPNDANSGRMGFFGKDTRSFIGIPVSCRHAEKFCLWAASSNLIFSRSRSVTSRRNREFSSWSSAIRSPPARVRSG